MLSAVTENKDDVNFYAKLYEESDDEILSSYWIKAREEEDAANLKLESGGRRLLTKRSPRNLASISLSGGFEVELSSKARIAASISGNCFTVSGEIDNPASPWSFSGELNMGNGCQSPTNSFSVDGSVGIAYTWGIDKSYTLKVLLWKATINVECGLSIGGYVGGHVGSFKYDCGRRLGAAGEDPQETDSDNGGNLTLEADAGAGTNEIGSAGFDEEEDGRLSGQHADDSEADADARRLFSRRRRTRRRRRRICTKTGFEILAGVGVSGGCSVSRRRIGVSLEGGLDLTLGPWPSPLDARAKATISAKGCIKIGPFGGCLTLPEVQLFDLNI